MASMQDKQGAVLERTARSTRGKRMSKLLDEELEHDEEFWGQDAFKEEDNDVEYEEEGEAVDEFDSDFDDDEPEQDEDVENEEERRPAKKRKLLLGRTDVKKKTKKKIDSLESLPGASEGANDENKASESKNQESAGDLEGERIVRKSTRTAVIVRQAERDALRALQSAMKPVKKKKEGEERKMTQEEMLLEAAQTEILNLRNLERMLAHEEEVKKKAVVHKSVYEGPMICFHSRGGKNILEFTKGSFPGGLFKQCPPYPEKSVCIVTGQPAKYRDPKTGFPYATKEAFKIIRERLSESKIAAARRSGINMGCLFNSLSGRGFSVRRKRSTNNTVKHASIRQNRANKFFPSAAEELINGKHDIYRNSGIQCGRVSPSLSSQATGDDSLSHDDTTTTSSD